MRALALLVLFLLAPAPAAADGFDELLACRAPEAHEPDRAAAYQRFQECQRAALAKGQATQRAKDAKAVDACVRSGGIRIGMTAKQAIANPCSGAPEHRNITVLPGRTDEQWVYPGGYVYLTNGVVTAVQTSR